MEDSKPLTDSSAQESYFTALYEILNPTQVIVTLYDRGEWSGSERAEMPRHYRGELSDFAYYIACRKAALKGGRLETCREEVSCG